MEGEKKLPHKVTIIVDEKGTMAFIRKDAMIRDASQECACALIPTNAVSDGEILFCFCLEKNFWLAKYFIQATAGTETMI